MNAASLAPVAALLDSPSTSAFDLRRALTPARLADWSKVPFPGEGRTGLRHRLLADIGQEDLSLARLAEAHTDALAILHEADRQPAHDGLYAVWASDGPTSRLELARGSSGEFRLSGVKQYCSGASLADAALVTAYYDGELRLVELNLTSSGLTIQSSTWRNPAFADTLTATIHFASVHVAVPQIVGGADWYLSRPGFWHGAIGPAACWAGGALSLVEAALGYKRIDAHAQAHRGALLALEWNLRTLLDQAGTEIDHDPADRSQSAHSRALMVRHLIERQSTEVLDRFGRLTGPALMAFDDHCARQYGALALYLRQCHAECDLAALGAIA